MTPVDPMDALDPMDAVRSSLAGARVLEVRLHDDQLAELADLVVERLRSDAVAAPDRTGFVAAKVVADTIGMSADWVREHAEDLGGRRMGNGPKSRWRFDLAEAVSRFDAAAARSDGERSPAPDPAPPQARRRRRTPAPSGGSPLLPIRGAREARRAA